MAGQTPLPRLLAVVAAASATYLIVRLGSLANPVHEWVLAEPGPKMLKAGLWIGLGALPWAFAPLLALLSDVVRLAGSRRRSWLLLATGAAILFWWVLAIVPPQLGDLLAAQLPLGVALVIFHTATMGLTAEVGQHLRIAGTASSVHLMAVHGSTVLLLALDPIFSERHLIWTAAFCTVILLAFGVFAARALTPEPFSCIGPRPRASFRKMFSSRAFWLSGLLMALLDLASVGAKFSLVPGSLRGGLSLHELWPGWISSTAVLFGGGLCVALSPVHAAQSFARRGGSEDRRHSPDLFCQLCSRSGGSRGKSASVGSRLAPAPASPPARRDAWARGVRPRTSQLRPCRCRQLWWSLAGSFEQPTRAFSRFGDLARREPRRHRPRCPSSIFCS